MSQQEVYNLLLKHKGKKYTTRQITNILNKQGNSINLQSVQCNIKRMKLNSEVIYLKNRFGYSRIGRRFWL